MKDTAWCPIGLLIPALSLLPACSEYDLDEAAMDTASLTWDTAAGASTTEGAVDAAEVSWWKLNASLVILEGEVVPLESTVSVQLLEGDTQPLCTSETPISELSAEELPDELLLSWWTLTTEPWSEPCLTADKLDLMSRLPDLKGLQLGVGSMHPEILAVIETLDGVDMTAGGTLNSAYATIPGSTEIYVYGTAGTDEAYAGLAGPATALPLTDGTWQIRAIYPFALR